MVNKFTCKNLQVGEKEKEPSSCLSEVGGGGGEEVWEGETFPQLSNFL